MTFNVAHTTLLQNFESPSSAPSPVLSSSAPANQSTILPADQRRRLLQLNGTREGLVSRFKEGESAG
jgi:hypothetical protein